MIKGSSANFNLHFKGSLTINNEQLQQNNIVCGQEVNVESLTNYLICYCCVFWKM